MVSGGPVLQTIEEENNGLQLQNLPVHFLNLVIYTWVLILIRVFLDVV